MYSKPDRRIVRNSGNYNTPTFQLSLIHMSFYANPILSVVRTILGVGLLVCWLRNINRTPK